MCRWTRTMLVYRTVPLVCQRVLLSQTLDILKIHTYVLHFLGPAKAFGITWSNIFK